MKYQVISTKLNSRGDKLDVQVALSEEESIFLNLEIESLAEKIDFEVEKYIKVKEEEQKAREDLTLE